MESNKTPLLEVHNLQVHFPIRKGWFGRVRGYVHAVDDISFTLHRGETLGVVGESGSGKTTLGRSILRAIEPTGGYVFFYEDGNPVDLLGLRGRDLRRFRRHMQMIFQDPHASLNPRMTMRDIIAEPLVAGDLGYGRSEVDRQVQMIAERCRLNLEHLRRFPHAFSGGQRQRIGIARALVANPEFIVCDESVSALDVSIQAEILNLLIDLQQELGLTYLFIT